MNNYDYLFKNFQFGHLVSAAPLEYGQHHEKLIHQENAVKHIDNHLESGTKPAGNNNDHGEEKLKEQI